MRKQVGEDHFQIDSINQSDRQDTFNTADNIILEDENITLLGISENNNNTPQKKNMNKASVFQTSINMAKMCMGTGTLALPFAATKGGLIFNMIGLFMIGLWNYYSANCLLRCLAYLPPQISDVVDVDGSTSTGVQKLQNYTKNDIEQRQSTTEYGAIESESHECRHTELNPPPPAGTTTYGKVAWYAAGTKGLMVLDLLMTFLFFGLLIAYEVAMMSFIDDCPFTSWTRRVLKAISSALVIILSCAPNVGFLSKFSGLGLIAVALSFIVIAWQGFEQNGMSGLHSSHFRSDTEALNLWPESLSDTSVWFGCTVFSFGVVPFIYHFRDSMAHPQKVNRSLQMGLLLVFIGSISIGNGVAILFSPSYTFEGDVLQVMPGTSWIPLLVRLLFIFVIAVTAPLIAIPCSELIEGKMGIDDEVEHSMYKKILIRVSFWLVCICLALYLPNGFVHLVSFIGCFCVSMLGFVLPPLFSLQLSTQSKTALVRDPMFACDAGALIIGITATSITSCLTFRDLMKIFYTSSS